MYVLFCFLFFYGFFLTLRRRFQPALKSTSYSRDTEHRNFLKWVSDVNPRLKSDSYSIFKNVSGALN